MSPSRCKSFLIKFVMSLNFIVCVVNVANNRCKWSAAEFASELICLVSHRLAYFPTILFLFWLKERLQECVAIKEYRLLVQVLLP